MFGRIVFDLFKIIKNSSSTRIFHLDGVEKFEPASVDGDWG